MADADGGADPHGGGLARVGITLRDEWLSGLDLRDEGFNPAIDVGNALADTVGRRVVDKTQLVRDECGVSAVGNLLRRQERAEALQSKVDADDARDFRIGEFLRDDRTLVLLALVVFADADRTAGEIGEIKAEFGAGIGRIDRLIRIEARLSRSKFAGASHAISGDLAFRFFDVLSLTNFWPARGN